MPGMDEMALSLEKRLPLAWEVLSGFPDEAELTALQVADQEVLRTIAFLEEAFLEEGKGDVARLDFKLNLILDLVSQIFIHQVPLPRAVPVVLTPQKLQWEDDLAPLPGKVVEVRLYLSLRYPRPVRLVGKVERVEPVASGKRTTLSLAGLSDAIREALEKLIFRHHRRAVAQSHHSR